jgi:hypothetical protein
MLAAGGIPVLVCYPDPKGIGTGDTGYWLPKGWQNTKADPKYVDMWQPGRALVAVMGCGIDLIDVDPRNGGDINALNGALPIVYAEASTPSGGRHHFIKSLGIGSHDGFLPGIDLKAGTDDGHDHGFAFIAPTVRKSKVTGEPQPYVWTRIDIDAFNSYDSDASGYVLRELIESKTSKRNRAAPAIGERIPSGERNKTLASLAGSMRRRGMSEAAMLAALLVENERCDPPLPEEDVRKIAESIGRYEPASEPVTNTQSAAYLDEPVIELDFWNSRPELRIIYDFALAHRVSPWALLGVVIARVIAATPHTIVLPPLIGGPASLNFFLALCGISGAGKGASDATSKLTIDMGDDPPFHSHRLGSGQGISHAFRERPKPSADVEWKTHSVYFFLPEVETLAGLYGQKGSILQAELRSLFMGEQIGGFYVDPSKRIEVPEHEYRAALVVGVQPGKASILLDDTTGGTPQRFLWMPATYPHPDVKPEAPAKPMRWSLPFVGTSEQFVMDLWDGAAKIIDAAHLARSKGDGDALDGHLLLVQEKVAAGLALLCDKLEITEEFWQLADVVMKVSLDTRQSLIDTLTGEQQKKEEAATGRTVRQSRAVHDDQVTHAFEACLRHAVNHAKNPKRHSLEKGCNHSCLANAMASQLRQLISSDEVIEEAIIRGRLVREGDIYRPGKHA